MGSIPELEKLNDPRELKLFVTCLPSHLITRWSRKSGLNKLRTSKNPNFTNFVATEASIACDKTTSYGASDQGRKSGRTCDKSTRGGKLHLATSLSTETTIERLQQSTLSKYCHFCKIPKSHETAECRKLSKLPQGEKQTLFRTERLF